MKFINTLKKILTRKKRNGYYEASQLLTIEEKQSLFIVLSAIMVPLLLSMVLIVIN